MKSPRDAFARILEVLDLLEIHYLIGGSVASAVYGIARPTMDVDIVVDLPTSKVAEFVRLLTSDFYADPDMIRNALAAGRSFNVIHYATSYKFDFFPLRADEYSQTEFGRRHFIETRSFGEPFECAFATVEDSILRKLLWYRADGEVSERQWNDLLGMVRVSRAALDLHYLNGWAKRLQIADLLQRLLIL